MPSAKKGHPTSTNEDFIYQEEFTDRSAQTGIQGSRGRGTLSLRVKRGQERQGKGRVLHKKANERGKGKNTLPLS